MDVGALHAHQHVGLEQRPRAEGRIDHRAAVQQHALVKHAPHRLVVVEALLHRGVGEARLVADHVTEVARMQHIELGARAGGVGFAEVLDVGGGRACCLRGGEVGHLGVAEAGGLDRGGQQR
ncbi:hypothetical protein D9M69_481920 [compost metagenome]